MRRRSTPLHDKVIRYVALRSNRGLDYIKPLYGMIRSLLTKQLDNVNIIGI